MDHTTASGHLVCNLWSNLIGPSVFLAEVASSLTYQLHEKYKEPIKVLDLFSGSGAAALATLNAFTNKKDKLSIICIDKNDIRLPDGRYLIRLRTDIFELIGRNSSFFEQNFDVIIADPPHFLTLDLLYKIVNDEMDSNLQSQDTNRVPFMQFLSDTESLFVLYYGHKEQERLSFFIIRRLGMIWPQVYNLRIADEKIVICVPENYEEAFFKEYFKVLKANLKNDYGISDVLILDKYNSPFTGE